MTTKVKQTEQYTDSQGEHTVCKGKLVLIKTDSSDMKASLCINKQRKFPDGLYTNDWKDPAIAMNYYKPLIISETEDIGVGDYITDKYRIFQWLDDCSLLGRHKILALPEHFSPKHLQAIIDSKLKDGDSVFIKCEVIGYTEGIDEERIYGITWFPNIKLFPIKKEESWDDVSKDYTNLMDDHIIPNQLLNWFKARYNPPTKK